MLSVSAMSWPPVSDPLLPQLVCLTSPYRNPVAVCYVCSLAYCVLLRFALLSCSLIFSREQFRIHLLACSPFSEFTASPYVLASCFCVAGFGVCHLLDFILELDALRTLWVWFIFCFFSAQDCILHWLSIWYISLLRAHVFFIKCSYADLVGCKRNRENQIYFHLIFTKQLVESFLCRLSCEENRHLSGDKNYWDEMS